MSELIKEVELPSGKKAKIYRGKVRDFVQAQKMTRDPDELTVALISRIVEIDGRKLPYEEWLEVDLQDFMKIIGEVLPFLGTSQQILQKLSS
jgi:hypothetical protein